MSKHRADVPTRLTPRYGRMAVLAVSLTTTAVALLGAVGVIPGSGSAAQARADLGSVVDANPADATAPASSAPASSGPVEEPKLTTDVVRREESTTEEADDTALPTDSGSGRRAVFSQSRQRVWIVADHGGKEVVERTYPVSGSVTDNLSPGTYEVYSRDMDAVGVDDSGTMHYFVRFTRGTQGAAIGFHDIPVKDGRLVQTKAQLGTPQSHGCIRQLRADAKVMWEFAQVGTKVVVTA